MLKKKVFQKLAGLWFVGKVVNHVRVYGSKAAEGCSAFQRWSCFYLYLFNVENDIKWKYIPLCLKNTTYQRLTSDGLVQERPGALKLHLCCCRPSISNVYISLLQEHRGLQNPLSHGIQQPEPKIQLEPQRAWVEQKLWCERIQSNSARTRVVLWPGACQGTIIEENEWGYDGKKGKGYSGGISEHPGSGQSRYMCEGVGVSLHHLHVRVYLLRRSHREVSKPSAYDRRPVVRVGSPQRAVIGCILQGVSGITYSILLIYRGWWGPWYGAVK